MNKELENHIAAMTSIPMQALSFILLQTRFKWCPVGIVSWALRHSPAQVPLMKLQAKAPRKAEREVDFWPTPLASSHGRVLPINGNSQMITLSHTLATEEPDHIGDEINPAWVETLMGFPEGWTELVGLSDQLPSRTAELLT